MHIAPWNTVTSGQQGQAGKSNARSQGRALLGKTEKLFFPVTRIPQTKYIIWKTADTLGLFKLKDLLFWCYECINDECISDIQRYCMLIKRSRISPTFYVLEKNDDFAVFFPLEQDFACLWRALFADWYFVTGNNKQYA